MIIPVSIFVIIFLSTGIAYLGCYIVLAREMSYCALGGHHRLIDQAARHSTISDLCRLITYNINTRIQKKNMINSMISLNTIYKRTTHDLVAT